MQPSLTTTVEMSQKDYLSIAGGSSCVSDMWHVSSLQPHQGHLQRNQQNTAPTLQPTTIGRSSRLLSRQTPSFSTMVHFKQSDEDLPKSSQQTIWYTKCHCRCNQIVVDIFNLSKILKDMKIMKIAKTSQTQNEPTRNIRESPKYAPGMLHSIGRAPAFK